MKLLTNNQAMVQWASLRQQGFTLIKLIVSTTILSILVRMAVPLARLNTKREREHELRLALWILRDAIDRYKVSKLPESTEIWDLA